LAGIPHANAAAPRVFLSLAGAANPKAPAHPLRFRPFQSPRGGAGGDTIKGFTGAVVGLIGLTGGFVFINYS
jgi:hypothetical protein